jgi:sec-independent protein translocase protein TatB
MFGIGFTELLLISIIAILFLGPDKLPQALVEMAKFIKGVKKTIGDAKNSLEEEMKIADLKEEALGYKKQLNDATEELKGFKNINFDDFDDVSYDEEVSSKSAQEIATQNKKKDTYAQAPTELSDEEETVATQVEPKNETVTFKKPKKEAKIKNENKNTKGDA